MKRNFKKAYQFGKKNKSKLKKAMNHPMVRKHAKIAMNRLMKSKFAKKSIGKGIMKGVKLIGKTVPALL